VDEVAAGYCDGPYESSEVDKLLGTDLWLPLKRFGVEQKNKVRGVDDASANLLNSTSSRSEKLSISSVDRIVATTREWTAILKAPTRLGAWALDELKAYRQIPIDPEQRHLAVVAVVDPNIDSKGQSRPRTRYFIMNGHCFGYTNAVYNYCRRPLAIRHLLRVLFHVATDDYVDDRWAIEPMSTIESSYRVSAGVFMLLGIPTQDDKAQGPPETVAENEKCTKEPWTSPELLGVILDLDKMEVRVKPKRRELLLGEIDSIMKNDRLTPGQASKLRGKLQFTTCTLYGRTGRAYMRPLSERQYEHRRGLTLNNALRAALRGWTHILKHGRPRPILEKRSGPSDVVVFTDGCAEGDKVSVGGVAFAWWKKEPVAFSQSVHKRVLQAWMPRENPIALVELFAVVLMIAHHGHELVGKRVMILVDSECALDALAKGYSRVEDVCSLVTVFWRLVDRFQVNIFLDRVSTDANVSDKVSRMDMSQAKACGWKVEYPDLGSLVGDHSEFNKVRLDEKREDESRTKGLG